MALVAEVVYLLGAGFSRSVLDPSRGKRAPLARDFFQVLIDADRDAFRQKLDAIRQYVFVDLLLAEIERKWHLTLDQLATDAFDIEECMTLFESELLDGPSADRILILKRAEYALRNLLWMYLGDLSHSAYSPTARRFGQEFLAAHTDVLTFNYDTLAEEAIESASGIGPKPQPAERDIHKRDEVADDDLDASHLNWKRSLACGFEFSEVELPIAGPPPSVAGSRYYAHPANKLYTSKRVLKLHGSIDWLKYTSQRYLPVEIEGTTRPEHVPTGIVQQRYPLYWLARPPERDGWYMDPVVIPPQLNKNFQVPPFQNVWRLAFETLHECQTLVVIGYSFPPTDFRTKRLFLEAFSDHAVRNLVVVNPDPSTVATVRRLTHHSGPVVSCDDLRSLYGVPSSWFDRTMPGTTGSPGA
jgi:hypothetical protein